MQSQNWPLPLHYRQVNPTKCHLLLELYFVADCIETTEEVGEKYKEICENEGGEHWKLIESLNVNEAWVNGMQGMINRWLS